MSKDLVSNLNELQEAVKNYAQNKIDLIQITIVEKASNMFSMLISSLVVILIVALLIGFGTAAFVVWYDQTYGDLLEGLLIGLGFLVVLLVLFIILRNKLVTSFMVRHFSGILLEEETED